MSRPFRIGLVLAMFLLVSRSLPALAHAELIRSSPVADERLTRFPEQVVLWFDEELDTRESWFRLFDTEGQLVHAPEGRVDLNDLDHASLIASMPPLPEEVYTVRWHAVTLDDNGLTEGEFDFIVGNATPRSRTRPGVWLPLGAATTVAAVAIIGLAVWRRVRGRR